MNYNIYVTTTPRTYLLEGDNLSNMYVTNHKTTIKISRLSLILFILNKWNTI